MLLWSSARLSVCHRHESSFPHVTYAIADHVQVAVDNIDADLFGRGVTGGFFQPSDAMKHKIRTTVHDILREAYRENMVRQTQMLATAASSVCWPLTAGTNAAIKHAPQAVQSRQSRWHNHMCAAVHKPSPVRAWPMRVS